MKNFISAEDNINVIKVLRTKSYDNFTGSVLIIDSGQSL